MRGAAFQLSAAQVDELLACDGDDERGEWLADLEEGVDDDAWFQYDKSWDAIHRSLGDGELLIQDGPPLAHAVFGSQAVMEDEETDTFAGLLPADEVPTVAAALDDIDKPWLRERYDALDAKDYEQPLTDEDFEYTWENLVGLRTFLRRAATDNAAIVFTI